MPSAFTVEPGVTPSAASALAEYSHESPLYPEDVTCPSEETPIEV